MSAGPELGEGFIEGCLARIGEDNPDEEQVFRDLWEDETQREVVIENLKADCEVRKMGFTPSLCGLFPHLQPFVVRSKEAH